MKTITIVSVYAVSLVNFRGPLIKALVSCGLRVYALAPDYTDKIRHEIESYGAIAVDIRFSRNSINPVLDIFNTIELVRLLRRLRPDIAFGYFIKPVIFGTLAAKISGVPHKVGLITGLGYVFTDDGRKPSIKRRLLRYVVSCMYRVSLSFADRVIFQNSDDLAEFLRLGIVDKDKAITIRGTGVDLSIWNFSPPFYKPITFLLAARLLREKGIVEFSEAAKIVKANNPDVRFILLGGLDSNPGSLAQHEIETWVNEGLLEWPGHVEVKPWLEKTSVFVLPSYREGVPRSTQEAMSMGRAIITTDAPGCRETVNDGVNGFLVPVRDVEALAVAMTKFVKDPTLIRTMGVESRKLAEIRFNVHVINEAFIEQLNGK